MRYKTILVHVDNSKRCPQRVELAASMAREHGAHLIGLYFAFSPVPFPYVSRGDLREAATQVVQTHHERKAAGEQTFTAITTRYGVSTEWRAPSSEFANQAAPMHARYADLVIAGQLDESDEETYVAEHFLEHLVLNSGRPVLIVPYAGIVPARFERILLAWNASREAARAGTDALSLLRQAARVTVMSINPKVNEQKHGDIPGADIALFFARHGIKMEVASSMSSNDVETGELLLSRAADMTADLIVMGGYGHSRLQEWVMGGVTRTLLRDMTVPVLMSH